MTRIVAAFPNLTGVPRTRSGQRPIDGRADSGALGAFEPVIAVAASPRDWASRLYRHVADHGGARLRATVLAQEDALEESFEVFVTDDTTSFLSQWLVTALHHQGRQVLGVYEDVRGKRQLVDLGVDHAIERAASTEELLAAVSKLAADAHGTRFSPQAP
ncbi:MAG: hypothetical protein ACRDZ4_16510 [Egibacteraceae bacterium]